MVFALTIGLFSVSIPAHYDWLANFADPDLKPATVRANLRAVGVSTDFYAAYLLWISVASAIVWMAVGVIIFWRRSDDWVALLTSLSLLTFGVFFLNDGPVALAERYPAVWLPVYLLAFFASVSFGLFFYLFPNGQFVPRWTGWIPILWGAHEIAYHFFPDSIFNIHKSLPLLDFAVISAFICIGAGSQLYRYLRVSNAVQRQQTKWVVFGTIAAAIGVIGFALPIYISPALAQFSSPYTFLVQAGVSGSTLLLPLSIGVAILRHRLWDVDVIINRTLVYGGLSASIVAIYVLVVGTLGTLLQRHGSVPLAILTTGLIAILFVPLRERLQHGVNRLMYGERNEPYAVLSRLARRLEATVAPETALSTIVETVAQPLKLPYAAITLKQDAQFIEAARYGKKEAAGELLVLPLAYQKEMVGELLLAPRTPGEAFGKSDLKLLEDLARQAGVAAHAVRLTAELKRSRERLVTTREEEKRRLRRDLHDGVGPQLAALMLELETASDLVSGNPEASALMDKLSERVRQTISDVRRSVHALRPPALDELGLLVALSEMAVQYSRGNRRVSVEAPEALPPLPAAVEVACYRIAQEAVTNVVRHAGAHTCWVRIALDEEASALSVEVEDDGRGIRKGDRAGVGMSSMRERAEELGGKCTVRLLAGGGTLVSALLPFRTTEDAHRREE